MSLMAKIQAVPEPEFSRPIEVDEIGTDGVEVEIAAEPPEREALARRFGLVGIAHLAATATVKRISRRLFRVDGSFEADVVQTCVVTLEPFSTRLAQPFSASFGEAGPGLSALVTGLEEDEQPEPIEGGVIDIGETVAQYLALALDPYPRKPGASVPQEYGAGEGKGEGPSGNKPFAGLGSFKPSRGR
jgi:uncharacterized metal-binding protein YceD (DUF177 family)